MVRSYLRHEPTQAYGVIVSPSSRSLLQRDGKTAVVGALEDVLVWDVKTGVQLGMWHEVGHRASVTCLAKAPSSPGRAGGDDEYQEQEKDDEEVYAVGYADGSIRIWDAATATAKLTLNGHKSAVTSLCFDATGLRLASAGQDTDVILWDLVADSGLFRLRGHRAAVTEVCFLDVPSPSLDDQAAAASSSAAAAAATFNDTNPGQFLLTTAKDGLMKLWDLSLQHCIDTVVHGKGEVLSLTVAQHPSLLNGTDDVAALVLTGSSEGEVKLWEVTRAALTRGLEHVHEQAQAQARAQTQANGNGNGNVNGKGKDNEQDSEVEPSRLIRSCGSLGLQVQKRVTQMHFDPSRRYLAVASSDRGVEVFRIRSQEDMKKKMARRLKRAKEKAGGASEEAVQAAAASAAAAAKVTWPDRLERYTTVRPSQGRVKSFSFASASSSSSSSSSKDTASMLLTLSTNALEVVAIPDASTVAKKNAVEAQLSCGLDLPGHRSEPRALALSSDDSMLASADSLGTLKVWNVATGRCVRTLDCGYALTLAWLPDDHHVVVGCKDGTLRTYDVRAGQALETIAAHTGPVWSLAIHPDGQSAVTASGDKDVKFWEFDLQGRGNAGGAEEDEEEEEEEREKEGRRPASMTMTHVRTLKMTDEVLCARFSPDARLLALSLLDSTVKVFYADSLKFFLSLYGHKLPVLSMDISGDSKLIVTVSGDKNAKIWGLDYGDCHRSLFAHDEAIVACAFERGDQGGGLMGGKEGKSHRFWTCARDGRLRYWDGDRFELVQTMEGHHGEVWALATGHKGQLVASAGNDRSIRVWEKTEEPLFLEEERERELERMFEAQASGGGRDNDDDRRAIGSLAQGNEDGLTAAGGDEAQQEATAVSKSTGETLMAGERLIEALDIAQADIEAQQAWQAAGTTAITPMSAAPTRHPVLASAFGPDEEVDAHTFVLKTVQRIAPAHLDDALLVLPLHDVVRLLDHVDVWVQRGDARTVHLVARLVFFLLRTHHNHIVANRSMRVRIVSLKTHLRGALARQKQTIGYNLAGLRFIKAQHTAQRTSQLLEQDIDLDDAAIQQRLEQEQGQPRKRKLVV
ncbi:WD40 repeat-like protein [Acaromyces ingoldii]|uniref:WD40 repeat-like protein n=1 Tax=Acaromyces ingoldii TaxID=215250 RepID=A0A316YNJ5_9BASI|nr:WD40 repeat-like protein [Acaromyces ingoldii]PWN91120.1 WD40 repeat-like protein [Acaromyces ingoldii]